MTAKTSGKNESERLFEEYLDLHGYSGWDYEPEIPGQLKHPDYRLPWRDKEYLLEVKELHERDKMPLGTVVALDCCRSVRSAINTARAQFKALKEYCCSLVVYNESDWQTILDPPTVFGSMLGEPGITWNVDSSAEHMVSTTPSNTFLDGGKMIDAKSGRTQNTTISSIVVLKCLRADNPEDVRAARLQADSEVSLLEQRMGRKATPEEIFEVRCRADAAHLENVSVLPRVSVFENPDARIPLCRTLFTGPYDERWALTPDLERVFVGEKLKKLEEVRTRT